VEYLLSRIEKLQNQLKIREMLYKVTLDSLARSYEDKIKDITLFYSKELEGRDTRILHICKVIELENERLLSHLKLQQTELIKLKSVRFTDSKQPSKGDDSARSTGAEESFKSSVGDLVADFQRTKAERDKVAESLQQSISGEMTKLRQTLQDQLSRASKPSPRSPRRVDNSDTRSVGSTASRSSKKKSYEDEEMARFAKRGTTRTTKSPARSQHSPVNSRTSPSASKSPARSSHSPANSGASPSASKRVGSAGTMPLTATTAASAPVRFVTKTGTLPRSTTKQTSSYSSTHARKASLTSGSSLGPPKGV